MEKIIFFALAVPILGFVFYLGGSAIMKGFKAKVDNRPVKSEEKEESETQVSPTNSNDLSNEISKLNNLGLPINNAFLKKFQDKTKSYNFLYANGINLIESFFKFDNIFKNRFSETIPLVLNKSKTFKNFFIKIADKGLNFF